MTLTLISVEDGYTVHEDQDGYEVLIATTAPFPRIVVLWEDFDLADAWDDLTWRQKMDHAGFLADLRLAVADPDNIDVVWCQDCEEPLKAEGAESANDGYACESCYEQYRSCDDCGEVVHQDHTYYTLHDESVCESCRDYRYAYCEDCDGYYHPDNSEEHRHGECDCAVPTLSLSMPNGEAVVTEDDRFAASLPSGVISDEGMYQIQRLVRNHAQELFTAAYNTARATMEEAGKPYHEAYEDPAVLAADQERTKWWKFAADVAKMDPQWQTKEGNFTKRLSKFAHKSRGLKVPPAMLTQVGNIGRDNSAGSDYEIELTRDLNLPAEEFYHSDSCWWQSYSESRCALKSNGGIGMRTFTDHEGYAGRSWSQVSGRAWIMPLRLDERGKLVATFDGQAADAYMIFNGYGDLSGYSPARIVAGMVGMTYRKIGFDCSPMYVNNGTGYLVTSEEIAAKYPVGSRLSLHVDTHSSLYHCEKSAELVSA